MRPAYLIVLFLCSLGLAEEAWWQDLFRAEDAPSPPRAEVTDPLVVDASLDRASEAYRGLVWMSVVSQTVASLGEVFRKEQELQEARNDVVAALLMSTPARSASEAGLPPLPPVAGPFRSRYMLDLREGPVDLEDLRTIVARYQESQGRRPEGVVIGQTMVMPAVFDAGEPVSRWVGRNVLPVLPDVVVEWGRDMDLTERVSWGFSRSSMSGEPTLLDRHVEESVKQVNFRVGGGLHFEVGLRRELLNNQPEDDLFEGGSGASEPFASLMWKF